jgi:hypothetical protein
MPDERVRRHIVEAMAQGLLPASLPTRTWGGFGSDNLCSACRKMITAEELETEFEDAGRRVYHLHIQCFAAWEAAMRQKQSPTLPLSLNDGYSAAGEQPASG